jgi:hypothetical protein
MQCATKVGLGSTLAVSRCGIEIRDTNVEGRLDRSKLECSVVANHEARARAAAEADR